MCVCVCVCVYHCTTIFYIFRGAGERNRGYALLMTANKPETALYRAPTFSLVSCDGISSCVCVCVCVYVCVCVCVCMCMDRMCHSL